MQDLDTLLLRAIEKCGTEYKLAERLGVSKSLIYERRISPELWALIADIAGEDPTQALIAATIEKAKGKPRFQWLADALGKSLAAGVVVTIGVFASSGSSEARAAQHTVKLPECALCQMMHVGLSPVPSRLGDNVKIDTDDVKTDRHRSSSRRIARRYPAQKQQALESNSGMRAPCSVTPAESAPRPAHALAGGRSG